MGTISIDLARAMPLFRSLQKLSPLVAKQSPGGQIADDPDRFFDKLTVTRVHAALQIEIILQPNLDMTAKQDPEPPLAPACD